MFWLIGHSLRYTKRYHVTIIGCKGGPANLINLCRVIYETLFANYAIHTFFVIYELISEKCTEGNVYYIWWYQAENDA